MNKPLYIKIGKKGFFKITGKLKESISLVDVVRVLMAIKPGSYTIDFSTIEYALDNEEQINKKFLEKNGKL